MKLMDEALQSHSCVISVMGAHANEGIETIFGRKMQDIDRTGTTYWLMRSPKARPPEVQDICKTTTSYVIFIEPASKGEGGARPTTTEDAASQFSPDRRSWKALPSGIGPVTGKLDTAATALVLDRLETVLSGTIDLWAYAEAAGSRTPLKFILGCSTVCAVKNDMSSHPERMKSRYRSVIAVARLPYRDHRESWAKEKAGGKRAAYLKSVRPIPGEHMNRWGIPDWLEEEVRDRDKVCVYCGIQMIEQTPLPGHRKTLATWEHIINDESIVTRENIARCCVACNSSKGTKNLADWLQTNYCKRRGINKNTVAEVVKEALRFQDNLDVKPSEGL